MYARHLLAALVVTAAGLPAVAADPADTALAKVPADAATFGANLRLGETVRTIGASRAWKSVWNDPFVQLGWAQVVRSFREGEGPIGDLNEFLDDPANKDLPGLLGDALSHEIFVYGGAGWVDAMALFQEVSSGLRNVPELEKLSKLPEDEKNAAQARVALRAVMAKLDRVKLPDTVVGFKVSDPKAVTAQLKRLDPVLADALKPTKLAGRSERVKVGGDEFLVLKLDGSLLPWDDLDLGQFEEKDGEFAPLKKHLQGIKLTVAVGVRQGYLLLAFGETADHLARFGGGKSLAGLPELEPVRKAAGKPLTAVTYTSQALRRATATSGEDVAGMAALAQAALAQSELPADLKKAIAADVDELAKSLAGEVVAPGAAVSYSFRTPRGWETFAYDYTPPGDAPKKPLTLLNHLGGDPLVAAVWRSGTTVEGFRTATKWAGRFAGHAAKAILAQNPEGEEVIKTYRALAPLVQELGDITEKLWLPALSDGQQAFLVDGKWASKAWHKAMPPAADPLPMLEAAVVVGVSDPGKLTEALEQYRVTVNKLWAKAGEVSRDGKLPPFEIPKPTVRREGGRTFAHYPIPEGLGVDPQFRPTGGLSDTVGVLTLSRSHAERLLDKKLPAFSGGPLADPNKPLDSAFVFNWAGLIDLATPWVRYATTIGGGEEGGGAAGAVAAKAVGLLKVFRGYTSATYREGGATVTHSEAHFRDIDPVDDRD